MFIFFSGCASTASSKTQKLKCRDVVYAQHGKSRLRLDVYYPKTAAPEKGYPVILCFHGGAWVFGDRKWDLMLKGLAEHGYAVVSADYRLSQDAIYPAQLEDARAAVRWLIRNSKALHLDAARMGVGGISAGGQIALLLAYTQHRAIAGTGPLPANTIKAVCALYPVTDLVAIIPPNKRDDSRNLVAKLLGGSINTRRSLAEEGSPLQYARKNLPPTFLIHGNKDIIVPLSQSKELNAAMRKAGASCKLVIYAGRGHAFWLYPSTLVEVKEFFDRNLK